MRYEMMSFHTRMIISVKEPVKKKIHAWKETQIYEGAQSPQTAFPVMHNILSEGFNLTVIVT